MVVGDFISKAFFSQSESLCAIFYNYSKPILLPTITHVENPIAKTNTALKNQNQLLFPRAIPKQKITCKNIINASKIKPPGTNTNISV